MTKFRGRQGSRAWLLAGACSSALLAFALPAPAFAQDASDTTQPAPVPQPDTIPPAKSEPANIEPTPGDPDQKGETEGQEIVVTGIRAAIRGSISIKKNETSIVEAITAEDIGKLPDISIADSIARLPGLAAQRVGGRAQVISIRGLAPDFTTTLLNGRPQASSGDNRAVEFDQYPSELLASVVIYKTPDANIAGMGLAGTADLRTIRPLLYDKRTIALNVRGETNTGSQLNKDVSKWGGRASASYIDHITPNLGIALGVAYLNSPSSNRHTSVYNYEQFCPGNEDWCSYLHDQISPDSADYAFFPTGQEIFATSRTNKRLAGIGILEWEPSDKVHTILDLYYSRFKQRETRRGAQWFDNLWVDNASYTDVETADHGGSLVAVKGTAHNVAPQLRNDYNTRDDWLFSGGLNNEYKFSDQFAVIGDLSYSSNKRDESVTETYAGYGCCTTAANQNADRVFDTISWDVSDNINGDGFPRYNEGLNYADAGQVSLGDRAPWGGWGHDGLTKAPHVKEQVYAADGDFRYTPEGSWIEAIDVGANFTRRDKKKHVDEWDLFLKNDRMQVLVDADNLANNRFGDSTSLGFAGFGDVLSVDLPGGALEQYYDRAELEDANHFDKAWKITEDVLTLKARTQFLFGNLHGNVGIQFVHQKQTSSGQRIDIASTPIEISPVEQGASYWDVLPSLNTYYDLGGGHRIRFALSKLLARPRMDEMRANLTPGFSNPCLGGEPCQPGTIIHPWSASGGNPLLEPWRAKAVDLSYEWYIGPASYISIAAFYKKLDNYIYTQVLPYDFSGLPLPSTAAGIPPGVIISPIGTISQPANGHGGNVRGIELSGALEFGRVTNFLKGFGVLGSISKTKSNLNPTADSGAEVRIPGLSGTVANVTGFYEEHGFQARISYRYRSAFKGEVVQLYTVRGFSEILADKQVDAQIGYTFPEGTKFQNLGFQLQVYNLTNSPYRTRIGLDNNGPAGGTTFIEQYEKYGRQVLFGVNYVF
jgi:iron complex outermembrane receptor protein